MKNFILKLLIAMAVLYIIILTVHYFTSFELVNIVFIVGIISCFFTYGGRVSVLGEGTAASTTFGQYKPRTKPNKFVGFVSPYFFGSLLTALSAFIFLYI
ncbi:hypothetical protein [Piscibacillus halophilus]|uniref:DUF3899 domain-containing protein n=1 Tax=Piscibacillus halophilus TaxID=571933 RepID=A0A1H9F2M1_9BACI|nr:hypothetical protein [Piscibacillus halophilus]SEQ32137.1 hypothetical protein SAMN05216362_11111 [Piscibacillus halophilus]